MTFSEGGANPLLWAPTLAWVAASRGLGSLCGQYHSVGWGPCMGGTIPLAGVPVAELSHGLGSLWWNTPMGWGPCGGTILWARVPVVELSHGLGSL